VVRVRCSGESEPMQHARAVNCQWASLESVIRASLGAPLLETHLAEMRKWVTDHARRVGSSQSKQAVGIT
jgi:hypothetical protein